MSASTRTVSFTCVQCPMGCPLTVTLTDGQVTSVEGNTCPRGEAYGRQEAIDPQRVVCALVRQAADPRPVSVKTSSPVSRDAIPAVLERLSHVCLDAPANIGDVVVSDVCGTGADVVVTRPTAWS